MKKTLLATVLLGLIIGCQRVPLTGRSQLTLIPNNQLLPLSNQNYDQVLSSSNVVRGTAQAQTIQRVGGRISQAVENYMRNNGYADRVQGYQWEFTLIESPQVNAWCMPGGKVAFYTGILPYCQNEAGIAAVMGHEIAHAVAEHSNERMSEQLVASGLLQGGQLLLGSAAQNSRNQINAALLQAVGAVAPVGYQVARALPHSRRQELEADRLGLTFMAIAGYNPQEAIDFWSRMAQASRGKQAPPEFLSTHPSDSRRISDLRKALPEAMKYYRQ